MIPRSSKKNIVIVGGGFGGVRAALDIEKQIKSSPKLSAKYRIILIDQNNSQLFVPSVYEIATTVKRDAQSLDLKKAVTIPYEQIFARSKNIEFLEDRVLEIDPKSKEIKLENNKAIKFSFLVLAVGSEINYHDVIGAQDYSCSLKDLRSAIHLRNKVEEEFSLAQKEKRPLGIIIGGGGVGGVELAGELTGYLEKLACIKNRKSSWKITIVQSDKTILPRFSAGIAQLAKKRLIDIGVAVKTGTKINKVEKDKIGIEGGKSLNYDILIWAAGIKPSQLSENLNFNKDKRGRIIVDKYFCPDHKETGHCPEIFIIGDSCCFRAAGGALPATAWSALAQGKHIARVIGSRLKSYKPPLYKPLSNRYVVPIKGKWAAGDIFGLELSGPHIWLLKELVYLRYLLQILPPVQATKKWLKAMSLFIKND